MDKIKERFEIVADGIRKLYSKVDMSHKFVTIEGGELAGTTTISKQLAYRFNLDWAREPSKGTKAEVMKKLLKSHKLDKESDGESFDVEETKTIIKSLVDAFTDDRVGRYSKLSDKKTTIIDRGILSTFIYQSGLMDSNMTNDDVKENVEYIVNKSIEKGVLLPSMMIVITSKVNEKDSTAKIGSLMPMFIDRANARLDGIRSGDEINPLDNPAEAALINEFYRELSSILKDKVQIVEINQQLGHSIMECSKLLDRKSVTVETTTCCVYDEVFTDEVVKFLDDSSVNYSVYSTNDPEFLSSAINDVNKKDLTILLFIDPLTLEPLSRRREVFHNLSVMYPTRPKSENLTPMTAKCVEDISDESIINPHHFDLHCIPAGHSMMELITVTD